MQSIFHYLKYTKHHWQLKVKTVSQSISVTYQHGPWTMYVLCSKAALHLRCVGSLLSSNMEGKPGSWPQGTKLATSCQYILQASIFNSNNLYYHGNIRIITLNSQLGLVATQLIVGSYVLLEICKFDSAVFLKINMLKVSFPPGMFNYRYISAKYFLESLTVYM